MLLQKLPLCIVLLCSFLLGACQSALAPEDANLVLKPASFSTLPGWESDKQSLAAQAFSKSCARIMKRPASDPFGSIGGTYGDWQAVCSQLDQTVLSSDDAARKYFESAFLPWNAIADTGAKEGLFTGYYEASLRGSRTRHGQYQTPLRQRPSDLVMVDLGEFRPTLKGQRIAGRVVGGALKPYEDHKAIDQGKLPNDQDLTLIWVDDPVQAFFLQIQGSGRIILDDGTLMSVGYAGQNGHPYYAIGRELIKRGALDKDHVSMQSIAAWLKANPDQAAEIMYTNPSYVFFKELENGPLGGENIVLTPERSVAVDRARIPYGIPVWLSVTQSLMVAQDTGGAIRGPIRGDIFYGYGERAEVLAGPMKETGAWWFLLPKSVLPKP